MADEGKQSAAENLLGITMLKSGPLQRGPPHNEPSGSYIPNKPQEQPYRSNCCASSRRQTFTEVCAPSYPSVAEEESQS